MEKPKTTPKDFFLWAGAMIMLYGSVFALISLMFDYINYVFPDALSYYVQPYSSQMSFEIASLIVLFPVFLLLMRLIRKDIIHDASRSEIWIRRWAIFLTLFIAGLTIVGDLITLLSTFLGGNDITVRFLLKVVVVLLVMSVGFMHFLADWWGYWGKYPERARSVGWGVGALLLATIVAGFFIMGTPMQARQYRLDDQKVSDLQSIQYQVVYYWQQKQKLPTTLADLNDPISQYMVPVDKDTGAPYEYAANGPLTFSICATFNAQSQNNQSQTRAVTPEPAPLGTTVPVGGKAVVAQDVWSHAAGHTCFTRTIDTDLYPPTKK